MKISRSQKTAAEDIIYPANGVREEMRRKGIKPKDHHKDNLNEIKKKKEEFVKKQADIEESKKESQWKMKKFAKVESVVAQSAKAGKDKEKEKEKVKEKPQPSILKKKVEEEVKEPVKAPEEKKPEEEENIKGLIPANEEDKVEKSTVPRASETLKLAERKEKNFVKDNYNQAPSMHKKPSEKEKVDKYNLNPNYGKVPKYLQKAKEEVELKKEQLEREKEEKKLPPGTRLLSEEERNETLKNLRASKAEIEAVLGKMPISMKTLALKQKKEELEKKIDEVNRAIETFSRPQVFISLDQQLFK